MAKQAVCDQCGKTAPLFLNSLTPGGWVEIQEHRTGTNPPAVHVCGWTCAAVLAHGLAEAQTQGGLRLSITPEGGAE
jgi:hypothetical protein